MKRACHWVGKLGLAGGLLVAAPPALACATCYGASDSPLAEGLNMGILSLLFVILSVLGAVAGFFVLLARRAAAAARVESALNLAAAQAAVATCTFVPSVPTEPAAPFSLALIRGGEVTAARDRGMNARRPT